MVPLVRVLLWTLVRLSIYVVPQSCTVKCRFTGDYRMAYRQGP
jgi:hypothetical protein